jgi:hypothetical protein
MDMLTVSLPLHDPLRAYSAHFASGAFTPHGGQQSARGYRDPFHFQ